MIRLRRAATTRPQQLVVRHVRLGHDGTHLVVVPTVGIIPGDDLRCVLPLLRSHQGVDDVHDEDLFVDRIRIAGMAILLRPGLHVAHGRQPTLVQRCEEVRQVVLVVRSIVGRSDQHWITWPRVVHVCGLRVIHERFVVRYNRRHSQSRRRRRDPRDAGRILRGPECPHRSARSLPGTIPTLCPWRLANRPRFYWTP